MENTVLKVEDLTKELLFTEWVTNMKSQADVAKEYNTSLWQIEKRIKAFGLTGARGKQMYEVLEEKLTLESVDAAYIIGLIIADGYINIPKDRVEIAVTNDREILQTISNYISANKHKPVPIYGYNSSSAGKVNYRISFKAPDFVAYLKAIGVAVEDKTANVRFPTTTDRSTFDHMFRGVMDGDGSIRKRRSQLSLGLSAQMYSLSHSFIDTFLAEFCKYYPEECITVSPVKGKSGKCISFKQDFTMDLVRIYNMDKDFVLQRKLSIVNTVVDDIVQLYGKVNRIK